MKNALIAVIAFVCGIGAGLIPQSAYPTKSIVDTWEIAPDPILVFDRPITINTAMRTNMAPYLKCIAPPGSLLAIERFEKDDALVKVAFKLTGQICAGYVFSKWIDHPIAREAVEAAKVRKDPLVEWFRVGPEPEEGEKD